MLRNRSGVFPGLMWNAPKLDWLTPPFFEPHILDLPAVSQFALVGQASVAMCLKVELTIYGGHPNRLCLLLTYPGSVEQGAGTFHGRIELWRYNLHLQLEFNCSSKNLVDFRRSLRKAHGTLTGCATFVNDWDVELRLRPTDLACGRVDVRLLFEVFQRIDGPPPQIELDGFATDQSYLLTMARDIDALLLQAGVDADSTD